MSPITATQFEQISDDLELKAAAAAAHVTGAKLIRRDIPPAQKTRDFDLVFADGSLEPLEVTRCADEQALETWDRIGPGVLAAPSLRRRWVLSVPPSVPVSDTKRVAYDVRLFKRKIEPALGALEAAGYERIEYGSLQRDARRDANLAAAFAALLQLRVQDGLSRALPEGKTGHISFQAAVGGITLPDLIAIGVERVAGEADNRAKVTVPAQARAHRRRCRATTPAGRWATRGCAIRPTRPQWTRSWR
jgi:hypothetical protein